eukprot:m.174263 g.174263  ORF g.174263 m.174263 type:complete len:71 (+) comp39110_c0_seq3:49-261(+)
MKPYKVYTMALVIISLTIQVALLCCVAVLCSMSCCEFRQTVRSLKFNQINLLFLKIAIHIVLSKQEILHG